MAENFPELKKDMKVHQINFTWISDLNVKGKTIEVVENKIVE